MAMGKKVLKILYVEDQEDDIILFERSLRRMDRRYELFVESDLEGVKDCIMGHQIGVIVCDYFLGAGLTGADVLREVRKMNDSIPFCILTGLMSDENHAVQLLLQGADDVILKSNSAQIIKAIVSLEKKFNLRLKQRKYERELVEKDTILSTVMESVDDQLYLKGVDREYLLMNTSFLKLLRKSESDVKGKKDEDILPEHLHDIAKLTDDQVLSMKKSILYESEYRDASGERVIIETMKSPLINSAQRLMGIVGVSRVVTDKKIREERLRQSELLLRQSEAHTLSGSFSLDIRNNLMACSEQFLKLLGLDGWSKIHLDTYLEHVYEAEREILRQSMMYAIKAGQDFHMEHRMKKHSSSETIVCQVFLTPDDDWRNTGMYYGSLINVSQERSNKDAIIDAQEIERQMLSAELHDGLTQKLVAASMYLASMNPDTLKYDRIKTAEGLIRSALDETRRLTRNLSLHNIDNLGLKNPLLDIIESIPDQIEVIYSFEFDEDSISETIKKNLYRIIQEAFANIMKYAEATVINLHIRAREVSLNCQVIDNGVGFDTKREESMGNGLRNIRQRVNKCNGLIQITSQPGWGTKIDILVPFS